MCLLVDDREVLYFKLVEASFEGEGNMFLSYVMVLNFSLGKMTPPSVG